MLRGDPRAGGRKTDPLSGETADVAGERRRPSRASSADRWNRSPTGEERDHEKDDRNDDEYVSDFGG